MVDDKRTLHHLETGRGWDKIYQRLVFLQAAGWSPRGKILNISPVKKKDAVVGLCVYMCEWERMIQSLKLISMTTDYVINKCPSMCISMFIALSQLWTWRYLKSRFSLIPLQSLSELELTISLSFLHMLLFNSHFRIKMSLCYTHRQLIPHCIPPTTEGVGYTV